uniref:GRIP domain-containing protein n=1 Tax=Meloidogyne hapla TaxID=6305 RepID=A0A1I8B2X0_MELHA
MFKGLRSKIEDEANRLKSTVSQYGENIANQVRSSANAVPVDDFLDQIGNKPSRRLSNASLESGNESLLNAQVVPNSIRSSTSPLNDLLASDTESNADFDQLDEMPRDKLNAIFQRFQARALNYKQKYKELSGIYREIENENEKYRNLLSATQEKAAQRIAKLKNDRSELQVKLKAIESGEKVDAEHEKIKKLQELLIKCKDEITSNRARITSLNDESEHLKKENSTLSSENSSNVQRVTAEWKGRFDRQEEEWNRRISEYEEETTQLKEKLATLEGAILTLEQEKADMVQKLSQAKQEGVKLVKESEERKYNDTLASELKKRDEEWGARLKEMEEQMQLSVEENDMQRKTSNADHERVTSALRERIVELEKNNASILLNLRKQEEDLNTKTEEISRLASAETSNNSHQEQQKIFEEKLEEEKKRINDENSQQIALIEKEGLEAKEHALSEQQKIFDDKLNEEKRKIVDEFKEKISLIEKENLEAKEFALSEFQLENDKKLKELTEKYDKEREELQTKLSETDYLKSKEAKENAETTIKTLEEQLNKARSLVGKLETDIARILQENEVKGNDESRYNDMLAAQQKKSDEEWGDRLKEIEQKLNLSVQENDILQKQNADHELNTNNLKERIEEAEKTNENILLKLQEREEELKAKTEEINRLMNNEKSEYSEEQQKTFEEEKKKIIDEYMERTALIEKESTEERENALNEQRRTFENRLATEKKQIIDEYTERIATLEAKELSVQQKIFEEKLSNERKRLINEYSDKISLLEKEGIEDKQRALSEQQKVFEEKLVEERKRFNNENMERISSIEKESVEMKERLISEVQVENDRNLKELNEEFDKDRGEFQNKLLKIEAENLNFKEGESNAHSNIKTLEEQLHEAQKTIGKFEADIVQLCQENASKLSDKENEISKRIEEMKKELMEKKKFDDQNSNKEITSLKEQLYEYKNKLEELKQKELNYQKECDEAKKSLNELKNRLKESDQKSERLAAELVEAQSKFDDSQSKQDIQISEMKEALSLNEQLKSQLQLELKNAKLELKKQQQIEKLLEDKTSELEDINKEYSAFKSAKLDEIDTFKKRLMEAKEIRTKEVAEIKKESEKVKQKAIADMKSEIKHLYDSINEKDCELASTHADISKLNEELTKLQSELDTYNNSEGGQQQQKQRSKGSYDDDGVVDLDEYVDLKRRFIEQEEELIRLKSMAQNGIKKDPPNNRRDSNRSFQVGGSDLLNFAEPTEAEYLRNVLYRYMIEREYLGRESVTLAKVICTVCKFPPEQRNLVLRREEARCQRWLPGSIHALNLHQGQINQRNRLNSLNNWNISSSALLQTNNSDRPLSNINALPYS